AEPDVDPGAGAGGGLLRSAVSENPGRLTMIDAAPGDLTTAQLVTALGADEAEFAVRNGTLRTPRLVPVAGLE
ncbi:MAG: hypothetical protein ACQSGP_10930, partial [Frankia sp.]